MLVNGTLKIDFPPFQFTSKHLRSSMAYRRRQQIIDSRNSSFSDDSAPPPEVNSSAPASSLATKAIRASAASRDSSLSSAYEHSAVSSPRGTYSENLPRSEPKQNMTESKQGFWGELARKAKTILDDDNGAQSQEMSEGTMFQTSERTTKDQHYNTYNPSENHRKSDSSSIKKRFGAITSSLSYIGGTIGNALEEGILAVENRTSDIIQETRKIKIREKSVSSVTQNQDSNLGGLQKQPMFQTRMQAPTQTHADVDMQLKASRDVSMAMAAKAKLLLRELKTVKADLAFAKERCGQLEEENRTLRESRHKGHNLEDEDLVRLQLESLLTEKSRLAQENSVYARENRFLREVVEYHQLTMQDVVYFDEGNEEVTQVYPIKIIDTQSAGTVSPIPTVPKGAISQVTHNVSIPPLEFEDSSEIADPWMNPYVQNSAEDLRRH